MQWRVGAALAAVLATLPTTAAHAARVESLLRNPGFESATHTWVVSGPAAAKRRAGDAHRGRYALALTARKSSSIAVSFGTQGPVLRRLTFLSPVSGALRGTFDATVWVRGSGGAAGKLARVELDEFGGAEPERALPGAVTAVRLGTHWQRVSVHGSVQRPDRIGAAVTVGLDDASHGNRVSIDDVRLGGDPLGAVTITRTGRWRWWAYALVWAVVLAGGAAWFVFPEARRRKTASAPDS